MRFVAQEGLPTLLSEQEIRPEDSGDSKSAKIHLQMNQAHENAINFFLDILNANHIFKNNII